MEFTANIEHASIFFDPDRHWNRDGYNSTENSVGMEVLRLGLGKVRAVDPRSGDFFRLEERGGLIDFERLSGYRVYAYPQQPPSHLNLKLEQWPIEEISRVTDVNLSAVSRLVYILDVHAGCIHKLNYSSYGRYRPIIETIRLALPERVGLTDDSRLAVVPRSLDRPEELDPFIYISSPASNCIVCVDAKHGHSVSLIGTPSRPNDTRTALPVKSVYLRSPKAIYFDEPSGMLFWADSGNKGLFALQAGTVSKVASLPAVSSIESMVVYRLHEHAAFPLKLHKGASAVVDSQEEPALLLATDSSSSQVYKWRLHHKIQPPDTVFHFGMDHMTDDSERRLQSVLILQRGDLLVTTRSTWAYQIRNLVRPRKFSDSYVS